MSRNAATVKVAETAGLRSGRRSLAAHRRRHDAAAFPSIALGVFEATPYDIATAYTIFPNGGESARCGRCCGSVAAARRSSRRIRRPDAIARADTTYLVTNMMRSVLSEGTGAAVRASGFSLDAAGKTGTTNDLRDAWFVGFTPELLTVVWVGLDDNQALGLERQRRRRCRSGLAFMQRALAGHADARSMCRTTSISSISTATPARRPSPGCLRVFSESFLAGLSRRKPCEVHRF